jgi:hypothetical protein
MRTTSWQACPPASGDHLLHICHGTLPPSGPACADRDEVHFDKTC